MKIYIVGHNGMVGSAILRNLAQSEEYELLSASRSVLDLKD